MTEALFLADLHSPQVGDTVTVDADGDELTVT